MSEDSIQNPLVQMQQRMMKIKEELGTITVEGTAGDGAVRVVYSGTSRFESVKIDPELVTLENKSKLEQLLLEAAHDAVNQVLKEVKSKTDSLRQEFGLPPV